MKEITTGLTPPPAYIPLNIMLNKTGYESIDEVLQRGVHALSPDAFETAANETGALILDTRTPEIFAKGFIFNSINIGLDGSFTPWVRKLIPDRKQQMLIVTESGSEGEVTTKLARLGFDYCIGYLKGGFDAWKNAGKEIDAIASITPAVLAEKMQKTEVNILDVRKKCEYDSDHVIDALNAPLDCISESMLLIDKNKKYYVHCAGGYRSMIFISILKARGYSSLVDVTGGFKAMKENGLFETTDYLWPTPML